MRSFTRMVWKKRVRLLPLVLALVGYASVSYGQQAEGAQDISPSMRLFYWYDPRSIEQVNQLEALRLLVQEGATSIVIRGILPPFVSGPPVNPEPVLSDFLTGKDANGDYAVLLTEGGEVRVQGSGEQMERALQILPNRYFSTDVDESTWGKIKELFQ